MGNSRVILALCEYGIDPSASINLATPMNPMNPVNPMKVESPDDAEIQLLTADIPTLVKALAQAQDNGPDLETISPKRAGQMCGRMRLPEVPPPSGKVQPGGKNPSRACLWRATKGMLRQWLVSYHLEIPEEYAALPSPSSPPNGVHGVHGIHGGRGIVAQPGSPTNVTPAELYHAGEGVADATAAPPDDVEEFS